MSDYRSGMPVPSTLVDVIRWRAREQPHLRACTFLPHSDPDEQFFTYRELDARARSIASLMQYRVEPGDRALLLYPPGLDFVAAFIACLYAGVVAVPAYPPRLARQGRSMPRLGAIVGSAQPTIALTTSTTVAGIEAVFEQVPQLRSIDVLATDAVEPALAGEWRELPIDGRTIAFIQFSSGSTGVPKGVVLTHDNLLQNLALIQRSFELTSESRIVSWLPSYHDMGLIGGMLEPLYAGFQLTLLSPVSFLQRPLRWLQTISAKRATISGGPNFAYDLCVRRISDEQRATLDLSSWDLAFNGAEPVRNETLERFAAAFASCGFRRQAFFPCYGLAEATLFVSGGWKKDEPLSQAIDGQALTRNQFLPVADTDERRRVLVSSGRVWPEQKVVIVDPETGTPCAPGTVGEIWVAGGSIAQRYWGRPDETETTLQARLAGSGEGPFLRTGDLGVLRDDDLFVTGRLKDMIIIRGQNHYPHDIEQTAEQSHPAIRPGCAAAFAVEVAGQEQLVVAAEIEPHYQPAAGPSEAGGAASTPAHRKPLDAQAVVKAIRQDVSELHELQVHEVVLLQAGSLPKTSSGKLQRHACQAGFLGGSLSVWGS